jgi:hypothetical protein
MPAKFFLLTEMAVDPHLKTSFGTAGVDILSCRKTEFSKFSDLNLNGPVYL